MSQSPDERPGPGSAAVPALGFPIVGMIGGGQLARMSQEAALALGVGLRVLAAGPTESAARAGGDLRWGAHDDPQAVADFARGCDVVTFDHEHVPAAILAALVEAGQVVRPSPAALAHAQDKVHMRTAISAAGVPCPAWAVVSSTDEVSAFAAEHSWPVVLKVSRGGYDGRGVWVLEDAAAVDEVLRTPLAPGVQWLAEQYVPFTRELAAQVVRSPSGQAAVYPVVRTVQTDGICTEVVAPCPGLSDEHALAAQKVALRDRGRSGRGGDAGRRAVRHPRGRPGQRAGDAPAQQRALEHRRCGHQPVREPPARRARPAPRVAPRPARRTP